MQNFKTVFSPKYASFGSSQRTFSERLTLRGKGTPSPAQYRVLSPFNTLEKAHCYSFRGHQSHNVYFEGMKLKAPKEIAEVPGKNNFSYFPKGPGSYKIDEMNPIGKNAKKFLIKSRVIPASIIPFIDFSRRWSMG